MGTDIHVIVEVKDDYWQEEHTPSEWQSFAKVEIDRCYHLFSLITEIGRCVDNVPYFPDRGIPDDHDELLDIRDEGGEHSFTWCLFSELKQAKELYELEERSWQYFMGALNGIRLSPEHIRIIFGFDS